MSSWASFLPSCMHKMRTTCIQHPGRTASARCWRQFPIKRVLFALQPRTARDEAVCRCNPPWYHIPLICWVRLTCFFFRKLYRSLLHMVNRLDCLTHPACAMAWHQQRSGLSQNCKNWVPQNHHGSILHIFPQSKLPCKLGAQFHPFFWDNLIFPIFLVVYSLYQFISHYAMSPWWLLETKFFKLGNSWYSW